MVKGFTGLNLETFWLILYPNEYSHYMSKILFINPIIREEDSPRHIPYGMAMLAAIVMKEGHQVQAFDANAWRPQNLERVLQDVLQADRWDIVAVGSLTTAHRCIKVIVQAIKRYAPTAKVVAGGGFLTSIPLDIMKLIPGIDIGVLGEAYLTFPDVVARIDRGDDDWSSCQGIIFRNGNGHIKMTDARPLLQDIDTLPFPAYDLWPLEEVYFKNSMVLLSAESMSAHRRLDINASYGCSLICRYCWHLGSIGDMVQVDTPEGPDTRFTYARNIRWHSPRYIVDLVKHVHEKYGVDFVSFLDENLMTMNAATGGKWLPEISRLWIEEGLQPSCIRDGVPHDPNKCRGVHFGGTSHAGLANAEVLRVLRDAGCSYLDYGLESFSDRVLKNIGKGSTAKNNERAIKITMEADIRPIPNQMIGFPDEFFDSILATMDAWEKLGVVVYPFFATAYPGSEWYYTYKDKILAQYDGSLDAYLEDLGDATKITGVISENFTAVELLGLRELMVKFDRRKILEYEKAWRNLHGEPKIPKFVGSKLWDRIGDGGKIKLVEQGKSKELI